MDPASSKQESEKILCYSFLPAEGVENLIRLRSSASANCFLMMYFAEVVGIRRTSGLILKSEQERQLVQVLLDTI